MAERRGSEEGGWERRKLLVQETKGEMRKRKIMKIGRGGEDAKRERGRLWVTSRGGGGGRENGEIIEKEEEEKEESIAGGGRGR